MPTRDQFDPDHPLPLFLSGHADEYEQRGTSPILKASILVLAVMAGGIAITLALGNPVKVFADATASLADNLGVSRSASQTQAINSADAQPIQSSADTQASTPAPLGAPAHDNVAAVVEPTDQARTDNTEPASGVLLGQFQAWAAKENTKEDAQAQEAAQPVQAAPVVEAAPAQVADDTPAPEQTAQPAHRARSLQNARAEIRHVQKHRARVQPRQIAREQAPPVQLGPQQQQAAQQPPMQQQPVQNPQPPSFLQSLGLSQQ